MADLKPCPFCGAAEPKLVGWPSWAEHAVAYRECVNCGAVGPPTEFEARDGEGGDPAEFDAAWNRRSSPSPGEGRPEAR